MKSLHLSILLAGVISTSTWAEGTDEIFEKGNAAFSSGKFSEAAQLFQSLAQGKNASMEVIFNLGNARFREGDYGQAILQYERAAWLNPRDPDVRANLNFAREAAGVGMRESEGWKKLMSFLTLNQWALFMLSFWVIAFGLVAVWMISCSRSLALRLGFVGTLAMLLMGGAMWLMKNRELKDAIVLSGQTSLKVAPIDNSPSLYPLLPGTRVRVEKSRGNFIFITTLDEKRGWLKADQIEWIVPQAP